MKQVNFQYENKETDARVPIVENDADLLYLINSDNREKVDSGRYYWLQKLDQNFVEQVKPTLHLFGIIMVRFSLDLVCSDNSAAQCIYRRDYH